MPEAEILRNFATWAGRFNLVSLKKTDNKITIVVLNEALSIRDVEEIARKFGATHWVIRPSQPTGYEIELSLKK